GGTRRSGAKARLVRSQRRAFMGALPQTSFGALLKQYRRARHLTQEALAEQAGLSTKAIKSLERGVRQRPHPDTVGRVAQALSLSAEEQVHLEMAARWGGLPATSLPEQRSFLPPNGGPSSQLVDVLSNQLPVQPTSFIGREKEVAGIAALLSRKHLRLLTL